MVEIDAITALGFGISADELCTVYRAGFGVLRGNEQKAFFDKNGRKVSANVCKLYRARGEDLTTSERTWTHPQSGVAYTFELPFSSFDREEDMRQAYEHFSKLMEEMN